ncbi:transposase [Paenibacillus plantiphilus]
MNEHWTPYSPELNPVEGLWKWLKADVIRGRCCRSVANYQI